MTKTMSKAAVKIAETRAAEANKILATTRHLAADVEDAVAVEEVAVEEPKKDAKGKTKSTLHLLPF